MSSNSTIVCQQTRFLTGSELQGEAEGMLRLTDVDAMDASVSTLRARVEELGPQMSATVRGELRSQIQAIQKKIAAERKAQLNALVQKSVKKLCGALREAVETGEPFAVIDVEFGAESKALKQGMDACQQVGLGRGVCGFGVLKGGRGSHEGCSVLGRLPRRLRCWASARRR